jgi:predicted  nucleic acid-binding Zn-ribbon protein
MAQESLLQKLDEAAGRTRLLERENSEALKRIESLEREASEVRNMISLAVSKADEMLKCGTAPDVSKGEVTPKAQAG